jgi:two-component system, chemotaxis family, protein-glutamate methylesterase/glutaminase
LCPSISHLFQSVARVFGRYASGVLLTGMGKDGAQELRLLRDTGAVTIVQDQASAVVYGMPGEAIRLDAAAYVLPPERIAARLAWLADKKGTER